MRLTAMLIAQLVRHGESPLRDPHAFLKLMFCEREQYFGAVVMGVDFNCLPAILANKHMD